jgi:ribosomal protein S12 methylthiotransferase
MKRPVNTAKIIENIKKSFPNIILRTSLIIGFPNETEDDFKELLLFVKQNYFEHVGFFPYSDQETASSYKLKNKISQEIIEKRLQILATEQFKNVVKNNKEKIGKIFEVLPEVVSGNKVYCRAFFQAPEIDNMIIVNKRDDIILGEFKNMEIKSCKGYDLIAK